MVSNYAVTFTAFGTEAICNTEREGKRQRIAETTAFLNEQSCEWQEIEEEYSIYGNIF